MLETFFFFQKGITCSDRRWAECKRRVQWQTQDTIWSVGFFAHPALKLHIAIWSEISFTAE